MIRLTADECVAPKRFRELIPELLANNPPIHAVHLLDLMRRQGVRDDVWARVLGRQGGWIMLTGDRGRTRAGSPRLPVVLPLERVTGVFLTGALQSAGGDVKVAAVRWLVQRITTVAEAPAGTRFAIGRHGAGFRLQEWPLRMP